MTMFVFAAWAICALAPLALVLVLGKILVLGHRRREEIQRAIDAAGEAVGTDPSLRSLACVHALVILAEMRGLENTDLARRVEALKGRAVIKVGDKLRDHLAVCRRGNPLIAEWDKAREGR